MRQENAWRVVNLRRAGESGSSVKSLATFVSLLSQFAAAPTGNYKLLSFLRNMARTSEKFGVITFESSFNQFRTDRSIPRESRMRPGAPETPVQMIPVSQFDNNDPFNPKFLNDIK